MGDSLAWVTLATNDSYSLGALVLAHSLKQVGTKQQLAVLITPGVTGAMRSKLQEVFNLVQEVNLLDSRDEANLRLLKRPELGITFTKLHCWRLTQFNKCVFLDADTLVLENCDELFERDELSAAPDIGWPDCFNSGVFVYRPSNETYEKLIQLALEKGSFDGGDQGLLNLYFSDWASKDISKHLPFIYNMASTACYSYLPAFKQFGRNAKIIHFIGSAKPWLQYFDTETKQVHPAHDIQHLKEILQRWWNIFCSCIHPNLSSEMAGIAGAFAKLTLGTARTAEQLALDDHLRRQGWEVGNIDYLGKDSFENIWSKICETLSSGPEPPQSVAKEPSPSKITPEKEPAKEVQSEPVIQKEASVLDSTPPQQIEPTKSEVQPIESKKSIPAEILGKPIETSTAETESQTVKPKIDDLKLETTDLGSINPPEVLQSVKVPQSDTELPKPAAETSVSLPESPKPTPEIQKSVSVSSKLTEPAKETSQVVSPTAESLKTEVDTVTLQSQAGADISQRQPAETPKSVTQIAPVAETVPASSEVIKSTPESISASSESIPKVTESPKPTAKTPEALLGSPKPEAKAPQPEVESPKPTPESQILASETTKAVTEGLKQVTGGAKLEAGTPKPLAETPKPASESPKTVTESPKVEVPAPIPGESVAESPKVEAPAPVSSKSAAEGPKVGAPPPASRKSAAEGPKVEIPPPVSSKSAAESPKVETPPPVSSKSAAESPKVEKPPPVSSTTVTESPKVETPPPVSSKSVTESPKVETAQPLSNVAESPKPESKALPSQAVKSTAASEQKGKKSKEVSKAEAAQPSPPTTPGSSQSKQPKQALGVEASVPDTPPPVESSAGPTPPPRKGGSDKKKTGTKAKK